MTAGTTWRGIQQPLALSPGVVHVIRLNLDLPLERWMLLTELLTDDEKARAARYRVDGPRQQFVICRATLRRLLSRHCDVAPQAVPLQCGNHGKPEIANTVSGSMNPRIEFNVSHSGRWGLVALTLDACSGGFDGHLLQALIDWRVPATIFVTGLWLAHNRQALAQIMAHPRLFHLGNHGALHQAMVLGDRLIYGQKTVGTVEAARQEVLEGGRLIEQATGVTPRWFRGATALYSPSLLPMIEAWGYRVAGYSLNGDAGASLSAQSVAARIGRAQAGDVIIAHINQPHRSSGAGVVAGVKRLVDQGFIFTLLDSTV